MLLMQRNNIVGSVSRKSTSYHLPQSFPYFDYLWQSLLSEILTEPRAFGLVNVLLTSSTSENHYSFD